MTIKTAVAVAFITVHSHRDAMLDRYAVPSSTGSDVGTGEPPAGSIVIAYASASRDHVITRCTLRPDGTSVIDVGFVPVIAHS
jgi:hypothetical protein